MNYLYQYGTISASEKITTAVIAHSHQLGKYHGMSILKQMREEKGYSREHFAEMVGTTPTTIYRKETGMRKLTTEDLSLYAQALGCLPSDLIEDGGRKSNSDGNPPTVPIVGLVGAGDEITYYDNGDVLDEIECPRGVDPETGRGFIVKGDSNEPTIKNGWVVFVNQCFPYVLPEFMNELCVVTVADDSPARPGAVLLKTIRKGSKPGFYDLESENKTYPLIKDVTIKESCIIDVMIRRDRLKKL